MPRPNQRHDHDPSRIGRLVVAVAAVALLAAGPAGAARVTLPSPLTPLTTEPPLGAGATSSAETRSHRVASRVNVRVSVDAAGAPFAVVAVQRLVVRGRGDYVFTIGAPLADVESAPGSDSTPGFRATAILWTGFNPGTRTLAARATLRPPAYPLLPLGIERGPGRVTLVNRTPAPGSAPSGDADAAQLRTLLRQLRGGALPANPAAELTSEPSTVSYVVDAPLAVTGRIGSRPVHVQLGGGGPRAVTLRAVGPIDLTVRPVAVIPNAASSPSGRELLAVANRALLSLARVRQYNAFLANPDPVGSSATVYRYVSASRPRSVAPPKSGAHDGGLLGTLGWIAAGLAAAALALVAWARA